MRIYQMILAMCFGAVFALMAPMQAQATLTESYTTPANPIQSPYLTPEVLPMANLLAYAGLIYEVDWTGPSNANETDWNDTGYTIWLNGSVTKPTWSECMAFFQSMRNRLRDDKDLAGSLSFIATDAARDYGKKMLADGRVLDRTDYPSLFLAIGTAFNTGGESPSDFRIPNLVGRFPLAVDGGHALGAAGGAETVYLSVANLPPHEHSLSASILESTGTDNTLGNLASTHALATLGGSAETGSAGGGTGVNNMPPYLTAGKWYIDVGTDYFE